MLQAQRTSYAESIENQPCWREPTMLEAQKTSHNGSTEKQPRWKHKEPAMLQA